MYQNSNITAKRLPEGNVLVQNSLSDKMYAVVEFVGGKGAFLL